MELQNSLATEELFWEQKAKVVWHLEGDRNTSFFHGMAKIQCTKSVIWSYLTSTTGTTSFLIPLRWLVMLLIILLNIFCVAHFANYTSLTEDVIPTSVDSNLNNMLTMLPSKEDITKAIFNLNKTGAPGPDVLVGSSSTLIRISLKMMSIMLFYNFLRQVGSFQITIPTPSSLSRNLKSQVQDYL